jgi:hypothetical protein
MTNYRYVVAGVDLTSYADEYIDTLENDDNPLSAWVRETINSQGAEHHAFTYRMHAMGSIAPQAMDEDAPVELMLLFAVLATKQTAEFNQRPLPPWDGYRAYLDEAFDYFHEVGETEAALRFLRGVVRYQGSWGESFDEYRTQTAAEDLVLSAHEDQEWARLHQRDIRAAKLLDPSIEFDAIVLEGD